jgi:hypothetical protein
MTEQALEEMVNTCGVKAADSLTHAPVYSVIAHRGLLLLVIMGVAIASGVVSVPETHSS